VEVTLIHFSQTGNTRRVAEAMASAFDEAGCAIRVVPLAKATPAEVTAGDLLGFGSPCFSSQAPTPVKAFLWTLPSLRGRRAFVFATSGGAPGRVLFDLTSRLQAKGADVVGGFLARGTLRHPAPSLTGRFPGRPDAADLAAARDFALEVAEHVATGRAGHVSGSRPDTFAPTEKFYSVVGRISTDRALRALLPAPVLEAARCDACAWCARECPMGNITLSPTPVLATRCIRCYRCLTGCPQQAFKAGWLVGDAVTVCLYNAYLERRFGDLRRDERLY
jgi:ferredoxin/flavodoxin